MIDPLGGEGNGNPLQCSCLDNPMDRGAWWATVRRVAKNWTRLKQLINALFNLNIYVCQWADATYTNIILYTMEVGLCPHDKVSSNTR